VGDRRSWPTAPHQPDNRTFLPPQERLDGSEPPNWLAETLLASQKQEYSEESQDGEVRDSKGSFLLLQNFLHEKDKAVKTVVHF
jgi:hypothetical protein